MAYNLPQTVLVFYPVKDAEILTIILGFKFSFTFKVVIIHAKCLIHAK